MWTERAIGQWYFKGTDFDLTPSRKDGLSIDEERTRRAKGVKFIQDDIAGTCVFEACKTEETSRKMDDVARICAKKAQKNSALEDQTEFAKWRHTINKNEPFLLGALEFDLHIEHPYRMLLKYARELKNDKNIPEKDGAKKLAQSAWAIVNDSLRTPLCLRHRPHVIASAAIYIAAKLSNVRLNDDPSQGQTWWSIVNADILQNGKHGGECTKNPLHFDCAKIVTTHPLPPPPPQAHPLGMASSQAPPPPSSISHSHQSSLNSLETDKLKTRPPFQPTSVSSLSYDKDTYRMNIRPPNQTSSTSSSSNETETYRINPRPLNQYTSTSSSHEINTTYRMNTRPPNQQSLSHQKHVTYQSMPRQPPMRSSTYPHRPNNNIPPLTQQSHTNQILVQSPMANQLPPLQPSLTNNSHSRHQPVQLPPIHSSPSIQRSNTYPASSVQSSQVNGTQNPYNNSHATEQSSRHPITPNQVQPQVNNTATTTSTNGQVNGHEEEEPEEGEIMDEEDMEVEDAWKPKEIPL
ncbi:10745_t:CDS:2 [Ambispora gerdemannii]|uniref:10745_t:CDS:1 n=1 Tax=Ambispora gerdemannii TaxID=144530 RepID=A0A9N9B9D6_9GLOM|nr:10745_t:CDS:2 [Ambispora gerdemannii]